MSDRSHTGSTSRLLTLPQCIFPFVPQMLHDNLPGVPSKQIGCELLLWLRR